MNYQEPSLGLLVSIAMRMDHSFAIRREPPLGKPETPEQHAIRQRLLLSDARRAYDEITGQGFYTPEREQWYRNLLEESLRAEIERD